MRTLICLALLCLVSCKAQRTFGESIDGLVLLQQDGYSGEVEFEGRAIRDQKTLETFYAQINRIRKPGLLVPEVDFDREMVLLVILGEQAGEKTVTLSLIEETATEVTLAVEIGEDPSSHEGTGPGTRPILQPFYLYKMPHIDKELHFLKLDR